MEGTHPKADEVAIAGFEEQLGISRDLAEQHGGRTVEADHVDWAATGSLESMLELDLFVEGKPRVDRQDADVDIAVRPRRSPRP